jgi:hypothetical protein
VNRLQLAGGRAPLRVAEILRDRARLNCDARFLLRARLGWIASLAALDHTVAALTCAIVVLRGGRFGGTTTIVGDRLRDLNVDAARGALAADQHALQAPLASAAALRARAGATERDRDVAAFTAIHDPVAALFGGQWFFAGVVARVARARICRLHYDCSIFA